MLTPDHKALLAKNLVRCDEISDAPLSTIRAHVASRSFACVRGLIPPDAVAKAKQTISDRFDLRNDCELDGASPGELRRNLQGVSTRGLGGGAGPRPKLLRTFYNPLWDADLYGMHEVFRRMVQFRNRLLGLPEGFALEAPERGVWTASRIHQYPAGGGFMAEHMDNGLTSLAQELGLPAYYPITLIMSRKGSDYHEGGVYFVYDGARVFFEEEYEVGDLVIYDDRILHGIEAVDPLLQPNPASLSGRLAAFSNLYRLL